MYIYTTMYTKW